MQADSRQSETIERAFFMPDILGYWDAINQRYQMMGFTDVLSDKERIEEYDFVTRQMNKYMSSHKKQITKSGDLEQMLAEVEELHSKAPAAAKERKSLVYMSMRDDWLIGMYQMLSQMIDEAKGEEDSDGYGA